METAFPRLDGGRLGKKGADGTALAANVLQPLLSSAARLLCTVDVLGRFGCWLIVAKVWARMVRAMVIVTDLKEK